MQSVPLIALLYAVGSAACWGVGIVAAKGALANGGQPLSLIIVQLTASLAVLWAVTLTRTRRRHWPTPTALSGVLEYAITYALAALLRSHSSPR